MTVCFTVLDMNDSLGSTVLYMNDSLSSTVLDMKQSGFYCAGYE